MTCKKWIEHNSVESIQIVVACKKMNRTQLNRINTNVEVIKRDYLRASVK